MPIGFLDELRAGVATRFVPDALDVCGEAAIARAARSLAT
jgi:hypothetical protein